MKKIIQLSLVSVALISQLHANNEIRLATINVTSASKATQDIKDVTSDINVITSQEIEERHYTTVVQALSSISGVSFVSNGGLGNSASLFVRGFDSKRVLVLIDGIRYNDITGLNGAPFEHLMIGDIEQIEVVKGAQSGVWGADASAGVINIITKSAKEGFHGAANLEYGSFNTKKYGVLASYKNEAYYFKASSQKITSDGFTAKVPKGADIEDFEKDGYVNTTSNIQFGFSINETNKIDISHTLINAESAYDGYNADPVLAANSKDTSLTNDSFTNISFKHRDSFNELEIYANRSLFDRNYPQSYTKEFDGEVYEYGAKSNISYAEKDFLIIGADYKTFEHKNSIDKKYDNKAFFITNTNEFEGFIDGKIILTESLRSDYYDTFDDKVTGKIGIKHLSEAIKDFSASANIGSSYNVPTLYNLYSNYGNTALAPENTVSFDISVEYKKLKFTYFNAKIEDMIDYDFSTNRYNNMSGTSTIHGYEIEYSRDINDDLLFKTNYTYLDTQDKDKKELARRPKQSLNLGVDYYAADDLHLGVFGEYIGKRYDSADKKGEQTGEYALVNFVANYDISKNFSAYAKIDNILNRYYQVVDGYATAPRSGYIGIKAQF